MYGIVSFKRERLAYGECMTCYEEVLGTKALVHEGNCEPIHEECLKTWIKFRNICPKCQATVDISSVFTWKERVIDELKLIKNDALVGAVSGVALIGLDIAATMLELSYEKKLISTVLTGALLFTTLPVILGNINPLLPVFSYNAGLLALGEIIKLEVHKEIETIAQWIAIVASGAILGGAAGGIAFGFIKRRF